MIIPTAEPFFFPGSRETGVLLIHGFTGTPKEMRWMGEYLAGQGFPCLGVRLAGHATRPEDMIRSGYEDWLASVEDGYHLLSGTCQRVVLAGLSMGGVLSLTSAGHLPVAGVVAMATPYDLPADWRLDYTGLLSLFSPYLPKGKNEPGTGWFDKDAYAQHVSYPQNPLRSVGELKKLLLVMRDTLPKVKVPVFLAYSQDDLYLPLGSQFSMDSIYAALGSSRKEKLLIAGSGHVLTRDAQRETIFKAAQKFIESL